MLDDDDCRVSLPSLVRWLAFSCWFSVTLVSFVSPWLLLLVGLPAGIAYLLMILGLAGLRPLLSRRDPIVSRWMSVVLLAIVLGSVLGVIAARTPSLGWLPKSGDKPHEYALSLVVAPAAFATIGILALRALLAPSLRRIAMVGVATFVCWPLLIAIRLFREPVMDIDEQFVLVAPWAVYAYVAAASITSLGAIVLMSQTNQLAALPVLPRARLAA